MPLLMPIYADMPYAGWHVDLGVKALGFFDRHKVPLVYKRYRQGDPSAPKIAKWFRDQDKITDFALFRDFQFVWPERICLDAILDARRLGATVRNYTRVESLARMPDGLWKLSLSDTLAPETAPVSVTAKIVVNTAGVWIDELNAKGAARQKPSRKVIRIKGIHILVRMPPDFAGQGIAALNSHNEAIFCLPWGENHYLGPTETVYDGDVDDVCPEEDEIAFMIDEANRLLPKLQLKRSDVRMAWAGVRPITYDPAYPKGRRLPFSVLHDLAGEGMPGVLALTWGTVNLHRVSAANILKAVRRKISPTGPARAVDHGASKFPGNQNSPPVLVEDTEIKLADLVHAARNEDVTNLVDLLFRRTPIGWRPTISREAVRRAAEAVAPELGWDAARIEAEVDAYAAYALRRHLARVE
jgi:glycerol-3-phosphate dehydrogenase